MPVHLLEITVRPDWQALSRRMASQRVRSWRVTEAAITLATILALVPAFLWPAAPWIALARTLIYAVVFWLFPLTFIYRSRLNTGRIEVQLADAAILLTVAAGVAFLSSPYLTGLLDAPALTFLALGLPAITWPWLARTARRFPVPARQLGLVAEQWPVLLLIGTGAGVAIGLHLLVSSTGGRLTVFSSVTATELLWVACLRAGLSALGEEMFFRGWCYHLLVQQGGDGVWLAVAKIVLLNTLVYVGYIMTAPSVAAMIWLLAYAAFVALACTLLRRHFHSLLPGIACNVVATVFLAGLIGV